MLSDNYPEIFRCRHRLSKYVLRRRILRLENAFCECGDANMQNRTDNVELAR